MNYIMKTKICTKCHIEKDETNYNKQPRAVDGLNYYCKECARKLSKEYKLANKSDLYKIYYLTHNDKIIYVGRTKDPLHRRKIKGYIHIPFYRECNIVLIEETTDLSREQYWIKTLREQGNNLLNKNRGESSISMTERYKLYYEENKDKIKEYHKEYQKRPEVKEKIKERRKTPKAKEYQRNYQRQWQKKNYIPKESRKPEDTKRYLYKEYKPEYYANNKEIYKQADKKYKSTPEFKEKWRIYMKDYMKKKKEQNDKKDEDTKTN